MKPEEALAIIMNAAESWQSELYEYIIPAILGEGDEETIHNYRQNAQNIGDAIAVLEIHKEKLSA